MTSKSSSNAKATELKNELLDILFSLVPNDVAATSRALLKYRRNTDFLSACAEAFRWRITRCRHEDRPSLWLTLLDFIGSLHREAVEDFVSLVGVATLPSPGWDSASKEHELLKSKLCRTVSATGIDDLLRRRPKRLREDDATPQYSATNRTIAEWVRGTEPLASARPPRKIKTVTVTKVGSPHETWSVALDSPPSPSVGSFVSDAQ